MPKAIQPGFAAVQEAIAKKSGGSAPPDKKKPFPFASKGKKKQLKRSPPPME
jgi:serine protease inhibitor ecotin